MKLYRCSMRSLLYFYRSPPTYVPSLLREYWQLANNSTERTPPWRKVFLQCTLPYRTNSLRNGKRISRLGCHRALVRRSRRMSTSHATPTSMAYIQRLSHENIRSDAPFETRRTRIMGRDTKGLITNGIIRLPTPDDVIES